MPPPPLFEDAVATVDASDSSVAERISLDIFSVSGSSTRVDKVAAVAVAADSCFDSDEDSVLISKSLLVRYSCFWVCFEAFFVYVFRAT